MTVLPFHPVLPGGVRMDAAERKDRRTTKSQPRTKEFLRQVSESLESLRSFWPVTLRQLYYNLVGKGLIPNNRNAYQKLSRHCVNARIQGSIPWEAIEDRVRENISWLSWSGPSEFISEELGGFLVGYHRDLLQSQPVNVEILIEKDALSRVAAEVARDYGVPVLICRGNNSVSKSKEFCDRAQRHRASGRKTHILYFGDLDPSGEAMLPSVLHTMQVEMGLGSAVQGYFCALQPWHVERYDLPHDPDAIKPKDSRGPAYRSKYGDLAVELDALPPRTLQDLVRESIEEHLDMGAFREEQERDSDESDRVYEFRQRVMDLLEEEPWEEAKDD